MKRVRPLILLLTIAATSTPALASNHDAADARSPEMIPAVDGPGVILSSSSSKTFAARETAGPDTFVLYGGPDHPTEGKFQLADGVTPDWGDGTGLPGGGYGGGPDAWTPVDLTDYPVYWHVDTHNAENLNSNGVGNHAMWSGIDVGDPRGATWSHTPGYGDAWVDRLIYESPPVPDKTQGETVTLDFRSKGPHVIGNGMRMDSTSDIRLDERWRQELSQDDLRVFDSVAGPLNRQYGYE